MTFSSGDWVAIAFGSVALVRWLFEKYLNKSETDEEKVAALRLDYEKYIAGAAEREKTLFESVKRIERSVGNLQSQLRLFVAGGADKRLEIRDITSEQ